MAECISGVLYLTRRAGFARSTLNPVKLFSDTLKYMTDQTLGWWLECQNSMNSLHIVEGGYSNIFQSSNRLSNADVGRKVSGEELESSLEFSIMSHRLRWLERVLRKPDKRLPVRTLHAVLHVLWRYRPGGEITTEQKEIRELVKPSCAVGRVEIPFWGTLETV